MTMRWRLITIAALVLGSIVVLIPRNVTEREYDPATGRMHDAVVRRIPISLGLDLRGGVHLALEVDESKAAVDDCAEAIRRSERIIRTRIDEFGTTDAVVQVVGDCRLIVELPGLRDAARARAIVQRTAFLEFRLADTRDQFRLALPAIDAALRRTDTAVASPATEAPARPSSFDDLLTADTTSTPAPGQDLPGVSRPGAVLSALLHQGRMPGEFFVAQSQVPRVEELLARPELARHLPRGLELRWGSTLETLNGESFRPLYSLESRVIITGEELQRAVAGRDQMSSALEVQFELTPFGGRQFSEVTGRNIGSHLAIVLDGRVQGPPPVITQRIGASGRIKMPGRSLEEASDLALVLRAGALPAPLQVVEERTIGATLGQDSIRDGVMASALAVGLVLLVMGVYYGAAGLLAVGALVLYVLFALAGLAIVGFALSLPGLAGFALSIGMAVDANVLIFERIREEVSAGKTVRAAVAGGFENAMSAIVDSNVTTALTAMVLFLVGTTPVKGFAVTLLIGLAASMITAIFVTRTFFVLWLQQGPLTALRARKLQVFANASADFIRLRRWAYGATMMLVVPGLLLLGWTGLDYSIEFTGGTLVQLRSNEPVDIGAVRSALAAGGLVSAEVQTFGSAREYVVRTRLDEGTGAAADTRTGATPAEKTAAAVQRALDAGAGTGQFVIDRAESVTPKIGAELQQKALMAVLFSFVTTLIYLAVRFEWRFGLAAVLATAHDVLATLAFIRYLDLEVSLVVVAAVLTVLGYSLNDTIVIFDRVRENLRASRRADWIGTLNRSVNETLPRTLLTGGTTLATALVLALFAGAVIRPFALIMAFGIVVGTLSSIFIATPLLLWIERRWPGTETRPAPAARSRGEPNELPPAPAAVVDRGT